MLPRPLTRVPLTTEDREDLEAIKRDRAAAAATGSTPTAAPLQPVHANAETTPAPGQPQVEVKLRLPDAAAHAAVAAALGGPAARKATHHQENFFFDGPGKELAAERAVLRVRFYDTDRRALITLKGKQILVDGIGRGSEVETDAPDPAAARAWVTAPAGLLALDDPLIRDGVAARFGVTSLVCLGGFANVRQEFPFAGHTLELDETRFEWGTLYEIEVESTQPEAVKAKLEALLRERGIPFTYSSTTKFHNFITGGKAEGEGQGKAEA